MLDQLMQQSFILTRQIKNRACCNQCACLFLKTRIECEALLIGPVWQKDRESVRIL